MEYLFFDTECANCFDGLGKICEFGFVLTDENFSVIEKRNILINPDAPFDKKGFAISKIKLAYPYSDYYKEKNFKSCYGEIKKMLTAQNRIIVGHGVKSDVKFIMDGCKRYGLKNFDYEFVDTERLVATIFSRDKRLKLGDIYNDFYPEAEHIQRHEAMDDAFMTMEIARFVANSEGKSFSKLIEDTPDCTGEVFLDRVVDKTALFRYTKSDKMSARNRDIFNELVQENRERNRRGKTFTLPGEYEKTHFPQMLKIVELLGKKGYRYSTSAHGGKYVSFGEDEARRRSFKRSAIISWQEFLNEIGVSESELKVGDNDVFSIVSNMKVNRDWYAKYKKKHKI